MARIYSAESFGEYNPILATNASADVSSRYKFASSADILATFAAANWHPVKSTAVNVRKAEKLGFQKHMVVLENPEILNVPGLEGRNASRPQIIMVNAHDRGSSMRLLWGMFRMACLNGIITGSSVADIRLRHNTALAERLPAALATMLQNMPRMLEQVAALGNKQLSQAAVAQLVKTVYDARLAATPNVVRVNYTLPRVRRSEDLGSDAFTIFNRVQEAAIRGGIHYITNNKNVERVPVSPYTDETTLVTRDNFRRGTTRAVTAIADNVRINQAAYAAALEVAA